ncbi:hypothetical protein VTI74DRAFT_8480 [Chaetomium olivicolor]
MAESDTIRRRKPDPTASKPSAQPEPAESDSEKKRPSPAKQKKKTPQDHLDDDDAYSSTALALDILRVLVFLFLASCGVSYLISNGETFFWGMSHPPKYLKVDWWKKQFRGPIYLTPSELALYNGSDPSLPIYLGLNGSIYDVSSNRRTYGPGGSYHYFAGVDAARAFVTGCFAEDRTPDMRGVEEMYLPIDDPEVDKHWTKEELEEMKKREWEEARKKVEAGLRHWVNFFGKGGKYEWVGYVKMPEGWPGTEPVRGLCEQARRGRKRRVVPGQGGKKEEE